MLGPPLVTRFRELSRWFVTADRCAAHNTPLTVGIPIAVFCGVPMFKLQRVIESGMVRLIAIGRIDAAQLPDLQDLVRSESARDAVLDLWEVTLVDSEVVRFLVQCETNGLRLVNCPAYIREWMGRESGLR
jgi:hypothetical protein